VVGIKMSDYRHFLKLVDDIAFEGKVKVLKYSWLYFLNYYGMYRSEDELMEILNKNIPYEIRIMREKQIKFIKIDFEKRRKIK
jgi:hypothetical protein